MSLLKDKWPPRGFAMKSSVPYLLCVLPGTANMYCKVPMSTENSISCWILVISASRSQCVKCHRHWASNCHSIFLIILKPGVYFCWCLCWLWFWCEFESDWRPTSQVCNIALMINTHSRTKVSFCYCLTLSILVLEMPCTLHITLYSSCGS